MTTTERIEENTEHAMRLEVATLRQNRDALEATNRELLIVVKIFDELLDRLELGLALEVDENDKRAARSMRVCDRALEDSGRLIDLQNKDHAWDALVRDIKRFEEGEPLHRDQADLFYVQDTRVKIGNCISWWASNGYTCHIGKARVFTIEELKRITRSVDRPWPKEIVDSAASLQVDHQRLPDWTKPCTSH